MNGQTVVVVDHDIESRAMAGQRLRADGLHVLEAESAAQLLERLREHVDVAVLEHRLPDADGLDVLRRARLVQPDLRVILVTEPGNLDVAVTAVKQGAFHCATRPIEPEHIAALVRDAIADRDAAPSLDAHSPWLDRLIGESDPMRRVKALLARVAESSSSPVLVRGDSGTGKDLAARALHYASPRARGPFLNVTCSALPPSQLETELLGRAGDNGEGCVGLFERADGGTLYLDEVADLPTPLQTQLLRFLEEGVVGRLGGAEDLSLDVRIIASTHATTEQVLGGGFREDLYYRLAVLTVELPPLRDRGDDIDLLVGHLLDALGRELGRRVHVSPATLAALRNHEWPGNVRELRNALERAILLSERDLLEPKDFALSPTREVAHAAFRLPASGVDVRELERELVVQALERSGGNQTQAGRLLGMNRDQIRYRIAKYGLSIEAARAEHQVGVVHPQAKE